MLEIELQDTIRCYNPQCRATIDAPGPNDRYCPNCGARQVFNCSSCPTQPGHMVQVARECACPQCGALYVYCTRCWHPIPVSPTGPLQCPRGCKAGVRVVRDGTHAPLANGRRTGAISCDCEARDVAEPDLWSLGEAIGLPACRYGRVYLPTERGTIRAVDETTGQDVEWWEQSQCFDAHADTLNGLQLQVSQRYVHVVYGGRLTACSVVDGERVFAMDLTGDAAASAVHDDRLLVCEPSDDESLRIRLYDTVALCESGDGLLAEYTAPSQGTGSANLESPTAAEGCFLVRDMAGNILNVPLSKGGEVDCLWENPGYEYVSLPAVARNYACFIAYDRARGTTVFRLCLTGGEIRRRHLPDVRPGYGGIALTRRHLYFYDGTRDFYQLDLSRWRTDPAVIFHGIEATGDMQMHQWFALQLADDRGAWLFSLFGLPAAPEPHLVHSITQRRPLLDKPGDGPAAIAASNEHIFVTDPTAGELLVYNVPCS